MPSEKQGPPSQKLELLEETQHHKTDNCPECGSENFQTDHEIGEKACTDCGLVVAQKMVDRGPEWRAFDAEQRAKRTRVGAPSTYTIHDKGLSTMIDWHDRDIYGKSLSPGQKAQVYRLRKWQRRIRVSDSTERNLAHALSEITNICNNLNLPKNVLETASVTYRKLVKMEFVQGRSINGVTASSVRFACRKCGINRTFKEIVEASKASKRDVSNYYTDMIKELDYPQLPVQQSSQYVDKIIETLKTKNRSIKIQSETLDLAYKILNAAKKSGKTRGKDPISPAAASIYIASELTYGNLIQKDIAEAAGVTEVTVRNRYKDLVEKSTLEMSL